MNRRLFQWWHARGRCSHRSHFWRLWCWREWSHQYRCDKHLEECHGLGCENYGKVIDVIIPCEHSGCEWQVLIEGRPLAYHVHETVYDTLIRRRLTWTKWRAKDIATSWWAAHWNINHNENPRWPR